MTEQSLDDQALRQLQSTHGGLLDEIDKLRDHGIGRHVDLPQLVVCGDQSSGKSSVLEAISRIRFPTKEKLCTRFATELVLRRNPNSKTSVTIKAAPRRTEEERRRLDEFQCSFTDGDSFTRIIDDAKLAMGLTDDGDSASFSDDVLHVEVSGPDQPHLTLVDLPGLTHAGKNEDVQFVRNLVKTYMANPRSIILSVVTAKNDIANQVVLDLIKVHDCNGHRTVGLVTKPDTLIPCSDMEAEFVRLAKNENPDYNLRLGWHVLRNRDFTSRNASDAERDRAETAFFEKGVWTSLSRGTVGIDSLRKRLSKVLLTHICKNLPSVIADIKTGIAECRNKLERLGDSRESPAEQRRYLTGISNSFQRLTRAAVEGTFRDSDGFFSQSNGPEGDSKRLRAVVHDLNDQFAKTMYERGHRRRITLNQPGSTSAENKRSTVLANTDSDRASPFLSGPNLHSISISRADLVAETVQNARRSRGTELPDFPNSDLVGTLFQDQARPWEGILENHVRLVRGTVRRFLGLVLRHLTNEDTFSAIFRIIIDPWLDAKEKMLQGLSAMLLKPHKQGHPITYDPAYLASKKARQLERHKAAFQTKLLSGKADDGEKYSWREVNDAFNDAISTDGYLDPHACSQIVDSMEEYYKIAIRTFIDNVAVLVIEGGVMDGLSDIFSPNDVSEYSDDLLRSLAAESDESVVDRRLSKRKLDVLQAGLKCLNHYAVPDPDNTSPVGTQAPNMPAKTGTSSSRIVEGGKSKSAAKWPSAEDSGYQSPASSLSTSTRSATPESKPAGSLFGRGNGPFSFGSTSPPPIFRTSNSKPSSLFPSI